MHPRIEEELNLSGGVIARRLLPGLATQIDWAIPAGALTRVLRGVYARPADATSLRTRTRAAALADPTAIICGRAAGVLHGWFEAEDGFVDVSSAVLRSNNWLRVQRRSIPPRLTRRVGNVRCTSRALTTVDLIPELGPTIVDEALRRRVLRAAGIKGWQANHAVIANPDEPPLAYLDIAFVQLRLAIEIDGAEHHANRDAFRRDRRRDETLALLGWQVVRFEARRVLDDPVGFANAVSALIHLREGQLALS